MQFGKVVQAFAALSVLAACSGPSTSPPVLTTQQRIVYVGQTQTISFSQPGGASGTVTIPAGTAGSANDTLTIVENRKPFGNQYTERSAGTQAFTRKPSDSVASPSASPAPGPTPGFQISPTFEFTWSSQTDLENQPTFAVTLPWYVDTRHSVFIMEVSANGQEVAAYPGVAAGVLGPAGASPSPNGSTVTFQLDDSAYTFQAGTAYTYTIIQQLLDSPGPVTVTPNSLTITQGGSRYAGSATLLEPYYFDSFSEVDSCFSIATIAMSSQYGPAPVISVTGLANGTCEATFSDEFGEQATLNVTVNAALESFNASSFARKAP